jgi:large subunit ribosomal protein L20
LRIEEPGDIGKLQSSICKRYGEHAHMTRARSGKTVLRRRKRLRRLTKGFRQSRHNLIRQSKVTLIRSRVYAFRDRRVRKRMFRRLWIIRLSAACRMRGLRYSELIHGLQLAQVELDRKVLSDIAVVDPETFTRIADLAKEHLPKAAVSA